MAPDSAKQLVITENRKRREEKTEKNHQKEKQAGKSRSSIARTARLSSERRRGPRALHGCNRRVPGSKTGSLRRRLPAYWMAGIVRPPESAVGQSAIQRRDS